MSKSKFQSEKDKQQSILNCIGSITGNLSEAVISGFNPSISNKRNSQQSPSFNPLNNDIMKPLSQWRRDVGWGDETKKFEKIENQKPVSYETQKPLSLTDLPSASQIYGGPVAPTLLKNSDPEQDKDFVGPPSSLKDPEQDKDFVGPPSSSRRPGGAEDVAAGIVNNPRTVPFTPDFSGDAPPNLNLGSGGNKTQPVAPAVPDFRKPNRGLSPYNDGDVPAVAPVVTQPAKKQSSRYSRADTIGNNLWGNVEVNGKEVDNPFNNPRTVPFTPDFSGDAPPNINLSSGGNKTQPVAPSPSVRLNDPYSQEIVTTEMDKANQTSDIRPGSPAAPTINQNPPSVQDVWNRLLLPKKEKPVAPSPSVRLNDPYSQEIVTTEMDKANQTSDIRPGSPADTAAKILDKQNTIGTPDTTGAPASSPTFKNQDGTPIVAPAPAPAVPDSRKPNRGLSPYNDGDVPAVAPVVTQPADTTGRPESVENVAAGIVNKQNTIGTPDTTGTTVFTSKTGDEEIKAPPKTKSKLQLIYPMSAGVPNQNGNDKFGNIPAVVKKYNKDSAAWELANPNNPAVMFKKQQDALSQADKENKTREDAKADYDPKEITRFNSQLAKDRQQGILRPGERYKGTPGVGSLEDSRRGRVGLDAVGAQPDNSPEAIKQRGKEGLARLKSAGWDIDPETNKWMNPTQTKAIEADKELTRISQLDRSTDDAGPNKNPPKPITTNLDKYKKDREKSKKDWDEGETNSFKKDDNGKYVLDPDGKSIIVPGRKEKAAQREIDYQENNLLKLQRRTDLTNARNALEDAQNRKTSSGWNMSSASRGGGGGGAGQPAATSKSAATTEKEQEKQLDNPEVIDWYKNASTEIPTDAPNKESAQASSRKSGKTMKSGTLIAELFDGDFLSNLKDAATAVGTFATPPDELLYTTGGVMGRSGFTKQGAENRSEYYQNILNFPINKLNSIAKGLPGGDTFLGKIGRNAAMGAVYPATKVAANMLTRMLYDPRSDPDSEATPETYSAYEKRKNEQAPATTGNAPASSAPVKTQKSGTSVSPGGTSTGHNPKTPGSTWVQGLNKFNQKPQQIQWNPYKANFSQQQYRAAAE